jgi:phospholipid/cholesterol/gamma-HCH transport system substrate-binding protein
MERTTFDLWFGAFVAAGFVALLVMALKVGNLGAESAAKTYRVEVRFDNIGGLKVRGPVRSAGVLVGRVRDIHFDNERFQAAVTLDMDQRYQFPKDTSASILTSGLLGETYVGLEAGGDDKKLVEGDRITIAQSAVVLEKLIGQLLFGKAGESGSSPAPAAASALAPAIAPAAAAAKK